MSKIVWLASYPKSGNTWVRFIIANLVYGKMSKSADVHRLIPDIHKGVTASHLIGANSVFIKSHLKHFSAMPLREDTMGAVYIVRHPLDVMVSVLHYLMLRHWAEIDGASEQDRHTLQQALIQEFLNLGAPRQYIGNGYGTWPQHVASWHRKNLPFPRLTLRYEDLKSDPRAQIRRVCQFLGLDRSDAQIDRALAASSFERLRRMEEREVAAGEPGFFTTETPKSALAAGHRFINKGETGTYRDVLNEAQIAAAKKRFGRVMHRFGYGD